MFYVKNVQRVEADRVVVRQNIDFNHVDDTRPKSAFCITPLSVKCTLDEAF